MLARLSSLGCILISAKPVSTSIVSISSTCSVPPTQPEIRAISFLISAGSGCKATTSKMARRPPGLSTRQASLKTLFFSGERLITQFDKMTSTLASATGRCSISPNRNSTLRAPSFSALRRALLTMSAVMSTPIIRPASPTDFAARKQSKPPPLPRSSTVSPSFRTAIA